MKRILLHTFLSLIFTVASTLSFGCHLFTIAETSAVDNGNGTYTYTFDICVGTEDSYGFYLDFTGGNLITAPPSITASSTGVSISSSTPVISGIGDVEYGDWDNSATPIFSDLNQDCFSMSFTFDNPISDVTIGGPQFVFLPPVGCPPLTIPTTTCFTPEFVVTINTDDFGAESTWNIVNQTTGATVASGGPYGDNLTIIENICIPPDCYDFVMLDAFGDGICCSFGVGSYSVSDATGAVVASGASFGFSETTPIPCAVLGIELGEFEVSHGSDDQNNVKWNVLSQENNDYFQIERSEDLINWEVIEEIKGAGTTNEELEYHIRDIDYERVINYYRLKQVDFDGMSSVFAPKSIDNRLNEAIVVGKTNYLGQKVDENYQGLVIEHYADGTIKRTYQR